MPDPPLLVAVDSNVLIDEELGERDVLDALSVIRKRLPHTQFVVTETVFQEQAWLSENGDSPEVRAAATGVLTKMLSRGYTPLTMLPIERGIAAEIALKLRMSQVIPYDEENDSLVVAEAALKGCAILLSSDSHLLDAHDDAGLWNVLQDCHVANQRMVIARPRDIVRKYISNKVVLPMDDRPGADG